MFCLKPLFTDRWISERFRRNGNLRTKPFAGQRSNHFECFLRRKIDGQIDIRRQSGIPMQQGGNPTNHNIPHTRGIQNFEYRFVDGHTAILANTQRNTSRSDISEKGTTGWSVYTTAAAIMTERSSPTCPRSDTD